MAIIKTVQVHNNIGIERVEDYITDETKTHVVESEDILREIEYGTNEEKTTVDGTKEILVTGYQCTPGMTALQFAQDEDLYWSKHNKRNYETKKNIAAIHAVMSFPGQIDPRLGHQVGIEFCERLKELGVGEFRCLISTHMNTQNTHNHILINSYSTDGKHKFPDNKTTWKKLKDINDELSIKYGLPIIEAGRDYARNPETSREFYARNEGRSWKEQFRVDMDTAINSADDYDHFDRIMNSIGYSFRYTSDGRPISVSDGEHSIRLQRLGQGFTYEGILSKLAEGKMVSIREVEAKTPKEIYVRKVYVSKYSDSGRRRGILEMLVLRVIAFFRNVHDYYVRMKDMDKAQVYVGKIQTLEKVLKVIRQYDLEKISDVKTAKKETGYGQFTYKKHIESLEVIKKDIILADPKTPLKDIAPMTSKQRQQLFLSLKDSGVKMYRKFEDLDTFTANEILRYLNDRENVPEPAVLALEWTPPKTGNKDELLEQLDEELARSQKELDNLNRKYKDLVFVEKNARECKKVDDDRKQKEKEERFGKKKEQEV